MPLWPGFITGYPNGRALPSRAVSAVSFLVFDRGREPDVFPMHFAGLAGMPRRIPDYALQFADFNLVSSIGAFFFGVSQLILCWWWCCVSEGKKRLLRHGGRRRS